MRKNMPKRAKNRKPANSAPQMEETGVAVAAAQEGNLQADSVQANNQPRAAAPGEADSKEEANVQAGKPQNNEPLTADEILARKPQFEAGQESARLLQGKQEQDQKLADNQQRNEAAGEGEVKEGQEGEWTAEQWAQWNQWQEAGEPGDWSKWKTFTPEAFEQLQGTIKTKEEWSRLQQWLAAGAQGKWEDWKLLNEEVFDAYQQEHTLTIAKSNIFQLEASIKEDHTILGISTAERQWLGVADIYSTESGLSKKNTNVRIIDLTSCTNSGPSIAEAWGIFVDPLEKNVKDLIDIACSTFDHQALTLFKALNAKGKATVTDEHREEILSKIRATKPNVEVENDLLTNKQKLEDFIKTHYDGNTHNFIESFKEQLGAANPIKKHINPTTSPKNLAVTFDVLNSTLGLNCSANDLNQPGKLVNDVSTAIRAKYDFTTFLSAAKDIKGLPKGHLFTSYKYPYIKQGGKNILDIEFNADSKKKFEADPKAKIFYTKLRKTLEERRSDFVVRAVCSDRAVANDDVALGAEVSPDVDLSGVVISQKRKQLNDLVESSIQSKLQSGLNPVVAIKLQNLVQFNADSITTIRDVLQKMEDRYPGVIFKLDLRGNDFFREILNSDSRVALKHTVSELQSIHDVMVDKEYKQFNYLDGEECRQHCILYNKKGELEPDDKGNPQLDYKKKNKVKEGIGQLRSITPILNSRQHNQVNDGAQPPAADAPASNYDYATRTLTLNNTHIDTEAQIKTTLQPQIRALRDVKAIVLDNADSIAKPENLKAFILALGNKLKDLTTISLRGINFPPETHKELRRLAAYTDALEKIHVDDDSLNDTLKAVLADKSAAKAALKAEDEAEAKAAAAAMTEEERKVAADKLLYTANADHSVITFKNVDITEKKTSDALSKCLRVEKDISTLQLHNANISDVRGVRALRKVLDVLKKAKKKITLDLSNPNPEGQYKNDLEAGPKDQENVSKTRKEFINLLRDYNENIADIKLPPENLDITAIFASKKNGGNQVPAAAAPANQNDGGNQPAQAAAAPAGQGEARRGSFVDRVPGPQMQDGALAMVNRQRSASKEQVQVLS
jgi:hypothetical protein